MQNAFKKKQKGVEGKRKKKGAAISNICGFLIMYQSLF